jgi:hypothetical protein
MPRKCIHTVAIDGWFPELCEITIPLIKAWASRIGADFNLISAANFDGFPPNYEKFQIWRAGKEYEWNIYLDADMIVDPDRTRDPTTQEPGFFYYESSILDPALSYRRHPYFLRDGRNFGVSDCFLATSSCVHDLWLPLEMTPGEAKQHIRGGDERMISELAINLNVARFGLKGFGSLGPIVHFHLQTTDDRNRPFNGGRPAMTKEEHVAAARDRLSKMGITTPGGYFLKECP